MEIIEKIKKEMHEASEKASLYIDKALEDHNNKEAFVHIKKAQWYHGKHAGLKEALNILEKK